MPEKGITLSEDPTARGETEPTATLPDAAGDARVIGGYRLLQRVGQGGMSEVWEAEQTEPVQRRVALKLIKRGLDSAQVIARFETERQALALMDHPTIAKVFDAGTTERGRPLFVMEHVRGVPITEYCDRHRMTVDQRLELFMRVCEGIQHAYQKAIIHRDVKPSNILVTEHDGRPVPKIIDFGVAISLRQRATSCRDQGDPARAEALYEALYERSLSVLDRAVGPDHPESVETLEAYADLMRAEGRQAEARELADRAASILQSLASKNGTN